MSETATTGAAHREVGFGEAISLFFNNYVNFNGRSSRGAFWWVQLASFLAGFVTGFLDGLLFPDMLASPINSLLSLAILLPGIGVAVRRLHDIGKSGWWVLIAFTIIGIPVLIYWYCQPGERQENAHGPDVEAGKA